MNILIVHDQKLPVFTYGGTERVIWSLAKEFNALGHKVSFLLPEGSSCDFAKVYIWDTTRDLNSQIPEHIDLVHFQKDPGEDIKKPFIVTIHGNGNEHKEISDNFVFVSKDHAQRHGSTNFVYNGLDWDEYQQPDFKILRTHFHFLGKAAWRIKNLKGAIEIIKNTPHEKLAVLGGVRFNFKMGFRFTFSPRIQFYGMVGGQEKFDLLNRSKGLIFPVLWPEPFGLAITESLFYGCPVFGSTNGSLPELIKSDVGFLSNNPLELVDALGQVDSYDRKKCHEYARDVFNSQIMAKNYLKQYEKVLNN
jgi:glycosyltransferase involved in cell wall biosynthesis